MTVFRSLPVFLSRGLGALIVAAAATVSSPAFAQGALREGVNFTVVKPVQPTEAPAGKVQVIEFFGYWCPHCNEFEPTLTDWSRRNDAKVVMSYVPIPTAFRAGESNFQRLYYALDALGKEKELRRKVFTAIHTDRTLSYDASPDAMADWVAKNGVDRQKFLDLLGSFSIQSRVNRGNALAAAYGITAVPTLAVAGKFTVNVDARSIGNADVILNRAMTEK